ncbi:C2 domain-containing protein [Baffinella frigidus]|nr:C2 domain-containing protein [Cryptophyta sp. CCMP2293]
MSKKAAAPKGADPGSDDDDDDVNAKNNLLKVKVVKADDIIAADRGGTSDAYAIVDFSGLKRQTQVVKKSLTPSWDETFEFECGRPNGRLLIEVYDYDWIGAHDFLGLVEVDLGTLAIEALAEGWFDLMPRPGRSDVVAGRIYLSLIIVPKDRSEDDLSGLDAFPWLDRRLYKAKGHARQYNVIQGIPADMKPSKGDAGAQR